MIKTPEKQLPIVKKAFEIDLSQLEEGYLSDSIICHAENHNKAKSALLNKVCYDNWKLKYGGELTYLNIPVKRIESADIVLFEGSEISRWKIHELLSDRARNEELDSILNNPAIEYCYIVKGSYYCPGWAGYTSRKYDAGVYKKGEAVSHARSVREISLEIIDVKVHNKMIIDRVAELESRIL